MMSDLQQRRKRISTKVRQLKHNNFEQWDHFPTIILLLFMDGAGTREASP